MNLRDNPTVAALAEQIEREQGFDPLDVRRANAAAQRYASLIHTPRPSRARKFAAWAVVDIALFYVSWALISHPPAAAFFGTLFIFSLIPTVRSFRAHYAAIQKIRRETLPYMCAFIDCIRATTDDHKMKNRIERQWLAENGLYLYPGLHYKPPRH